MAIGPDLQAARQNKQLTASQVAEMTRMKVQIVEDLEQDDFHRIAATIYGKGFIKLYAEVVDLDPEPLIQDYLQSVGKGQAPPARDEAAKASASSPGTTAQPEPVGEAETPSQAAAAESASEPTPPPDDLFSFSQARKKAIVSRPDEQAQASPSPASTSPSPAYAWFAKTAPRLWQIVRETTAKGWHACKRKLEKGLDHVSRSGDHDKWIQRILLFLAAGILLLLLIPVVRMLVRPGKQEWVSDQELILFSSLPEPYAEQQ